MEVYAASVAKTASGLAAAHEILERVAKTHGVLCLLVNAVGECEEGLCTGGSAAWAPGGELLGVLDAATEALLIVDTDTMQTKTCKLQQKTV